MYPSSSALHWISLSYLVAWAIQTTGVCAQSRIFNGDITTIDYVPYIVQLRDAKNNRGYCAGTLVAAKYVVTAGHCFLNRKPENIRVVGGASTRSDVGVARGIVNLIRHPEYDMTTVHSDIAILELDSEMVGQNIRTAPLCNQALREGDFLQISGWGQTERVDSSPELRTVDVAKLSTQECSDKFGPFVEKNMFCVSGLDGKSSCAGDSGGPVIYNGQLCGVVSIGYKCGAPNHADAITDIYAVRSFVEKYVRN